MFEASEFMVFDVESVGLHGEGFAVGFVLIDQGGKESGSGYFACPREICRGTAIDHEWCRQHVDAHPNCDSAKEMRAEFWGAWRRCHNGGGILAAECPWPVEANFLSACIADSTDRLKTSPYPLIDVATVRMAAGFDPLETCDRLHRELPAHNPLADARQSARLLSEALREIRGDMPKVRRTGITERAIERCGYGPVVLDESAPNGDRLINALSRFGRVAAGTAVTVFQGAGGTWYIETAAVAKA